MPTSRARTPRPEYRLLRGLLESVETLMNNGYLAQAVEEIEKFYKHVSFLESFDGPELQEILDEGRRLAGELRGRIGERAMSGRHSLGARAEPPIAKIESNLDRVRDLMKRGYAASALELLETIHQALWYWENAGHPEIQRLLDEARSLAGQIRGKMGGQLGAITPEMERYYTRGACPYLAIALHERTGWPLAIMTDADSEPESWGGLKKYPMIAHVFVITPSGLALDIRGERPIERLKEEWYDLVVPVIEELSLRELKSLMGEKRPLEVCSLEEMRKARALVDEILG